MKNVKTGNMIVALAAIALLGVTTLQVQGQGKKKRVPLAVTSISKDSTQAPDADQRKLAIFDSTRYSYFLFPEFYTYWPIDNNDTILKYECYDINRNFVSVDTIYNISDVAHIAFVKTYTDYLQTTINADGKPTPKLIVQKLYTYDRTGDDTWTSYDLKFRVTSQLKEFRNDIIRTDTTTVRDAITSTRQITIRKYYKVVELDRSDSGAASPDLVALDNVDNGQKNVAAVYTYLVPEFYFYVPRKSRDTIYEFKSYDSRDSIIANVENYDTVKYFSLFKSFIDSTHTYSDNDGSKKPLPVSTIIKRYDRMSKDRWMTIEYPKNKFQELTEYRNEIARTDTITVIDPLTDKTVLKVFKYYKLIK